MKKGHHHSFWHTVFFVIGIVATAAVIINLFILSSPSKKKLSVSRHLDATSGTLLSTLARLTNAPVIIGGTIEILNNGDAFYPALYRDIDAATRSINFNVYIWEPGAESDALFGHLIKKAREGVAVRLIIDGFGGKSAPQKDITALREAGGSVSIYHPPTFGKLTKYYKRDHARSIVIDDAIGYTGGMAVADYWSGGAADKDHWRDTMFRVTGPALAHIQNTFTALWEIASGEVLTPMESPQKITTATAMQTVSLNSFSPDEDVQELSTFLALSITSAKKTIIIETPYMVLEHRLEQALIDAAKRGVDVRILLPGEIIDSKTVQTASQHYYTLLLSGGVKIYEYQPTMMHAKALVVDGVWSVIGSANIDTRSTYFNVENVIGVQDTDFATALTTTLNQDFSNATEITLDQWKTRNTFRKILEGVVYVFNKQF